MASGLHSLVAATYGSALIGAMVASVLYGIATLQTYLYFHYYPEDNLRLKLMVAVVWVIETLHVAFVNRFLYIYLINYFGNALELIKAHWTLYISVLCNLIVGVIVQTFFASRIHTLGKKYWLTGLIGVSILAHVAFGIETVVKCFHYKYFTEVSTFKYSTSLPLGLFSVIPDVLISGSLCYFLKSSKNKVSGIKSTEVIIDLLMQYAINRVLLTSAAVIAELVCTLAMPESFSYLALDFCVGKLYSNTLLATLNARKYVRSKGSNVVVSGASPVVGGGGSDSSGTLESEMAFAIPVTVQMQMSGSTRSGTQNMFDVSGRQTVSTDDSVYEDTKHAKLGDMV